MFLPSFSRWRWSQRPAVPDNFLEHAIPNLALAADDEVGVVLVEIDDRLGLGQLVAVDHEADDSIAAVAGVVRHDAHGEARFRVTEAPEKFTLGMHELAEGEEPF
jgi:hypothetical protein